jgi:hypothetical protein
LINIFPAPAGRHCKNRGRSNTLRKKIMKTNLPFDTHVSEYEEWFDEYPAVFKSEVEALREMMPEGDKLTGIEVGLGTGRFSEALGIKEGVEPSENMRALAIKGALR